MDYPKNRHDYLKEYSNYLNDLELTDWLKSVVKEFCPTLWNKIETPSDMAIKSYILLELTKDRYSCYKVIEFLKRSEIPTNVELAEKITKFNRSPGRHYYGDETYIEVFPVLPTDVKKTNTQNYSMCKKPRGKAVIINVIPDEVKREAFRFYNIFEQLFFEVQLHLKLSITQIKAELRKVLNDINEKFDKTLETDEAIIVMIITHGIDDMIVGHPFCKGTDFTDLIHIDDIVDIFNEIDDKIKIFFFTCCRDYKNMIPKMNAVKLGRKTINDTFVYYSCAEGYETPVLEKDFYTPYGKMLSESIAQFAYKDHLVEIMNKTNQALKPGIKMVKNEEEKGEFAPESRNKSTTHKVYFNPGWFEDKQSDTFI